MKHGKKYAESVKLVDKTKLYDTDEALALTVKTATAKFDETVELHIRLGVDSRHADQQVRGAVILPNGTGKRVRVASLRKARTRMPLPLRAQRSSVRKISLSRCRAVCWTLTSASRRPT